MISKKLLAIVSIAFASITAHAQSDTQFVVSTGDIKTGSTYAKMFEEFVAACPTPNGVTLMQQTSSGSIQNVERIVQNQVNGAFVQSDMLFLAKMENPADVISIKTIFTLHPEELHFIARGDVKKEGGFMGIGANEVRFDNVESLSGRGIGAVGGSVKTAKLVSSQAGLNLRVIEFNSNDDMLGALLAGKIDSILVVAGAPSKMVGNLDARFKLLPMSQKTRSALSEIYAPAKVGYKNLTKAPVDTVSVQALFVSRTYRSKTMVGAIDAMRKCLNDKLGDIQDARGTHAKWQVVEPTDKGRWVWYETK